MMLTFPLAPSSAPILAPGSLPPALRVYAVGDVHGCDHRLAELHADIAADLAARPVDRAMIIHLGDYIDRGEDSAGVVARLRRHGQPGEVLPPELRMVNLIGNHEQMMLAALTERRPEAAAVWLRNGGAASLRSWGITPEMPLDAWEQQLPAGYLDWLQGLRLSVQVGSYLFVHAGIRPGIALAEQKRDDLIWIREPFLSWQGAWAPGSEGGLVVVHGHTPGERPVLRANRIGIDTGAVMGGRLTCAVLQDNQLGFIYR